jgi:hypothetical protein
MIIVFVLTASEGKELAVIRYQGSMGEVTATHLSHFIFPTRVLKVAVRAVLSVSCRRRQTLQPPSQTSPK